MAVNKAKTGPVAVAPLTKDGVLKTVALTVVTLGIYGMYWYFKRIPEINALPTEAKVLPQLPQAYIGAFALNIVCAVALPNVSSLASLAMWGVALYMAFQARTVLQEHARKAGREDFQLNPVWTFLGQFWYLQHKINQL